ncbi:effector-associated domain EAD1-containing protein [Streptomyces sp. NPDC001536]|uniref:effector-associated domain EAD1-containing protein n=1 Tax=Streptomyces sp. NPDC001536 TaxID=3364583 RepID=UPI0036976A03
MAALTAVQLHRDGVLRVVATLYADAAEAQQLLYRLGADPARLPQFGGGQAPLNTWFAVCRLIENGAFRFTLEDLLAEAARDFPGNPVLHSVTPAAPDEPVLLTPPDDLTVLCLLAGPEHASRLRLRREYRAIEQAARQGSRRTLDVRLSAAIGPRDVTAALTEHRPDILHFGGYGAPSGHLPLGEDAVWVAAIGAETLAAVLEAVGGVTVVVFTGCSPGPYAEAIAPHTQEVIGSPGPLTDEDALAFCRDYYAGLASGESWEGAFGRGRAGAGSGSRASADLLRVTRAREGDTV